jgi:hypothetical protein
VRVGNVAFVPPRGFAADVCVQIAERHKGDCHRPRHELRLQGQRKPLTKNARRDVGIKDDVAHPMYARRDAYKSTLPASKFLNGADDVLDRHLRVDAVLVEQVDPVGAYPMQGVVHGGLDVV